MASGIQQRTGGIRASVASDEHHDTIQEEVCDMTRKEVQGTSTDVTTIGGEKRREGERRNRYSTAVIEGIKRNATKYVGDSIVRKTDTILSKGEDVVVCLSGARIEHVTERVEKIMGRGKGGTILVHLGTNNADKEGTPAIVDKYRKLLKKSKEAGVGQIILSGILPVFGNRIDGYRNSKRMAINGSGFARKRTLNTWICGTALWAKKKCTRGTVCTLVGRGLPPLPRDCQGRLPVDWVKYDI